MWQALAHGAKAAEDLQCRYSEVSMGYEFNRMIVDFTMFNQGKTVRCAISTAAMDDLEGKPDVGQISE